MANDISIIIPVYNRAKLLGRTLEAVAAQTRRPLNVVLVDNNSTDESLRLLHEWKRAVEAPDFHITVAEEPRRGASAARNAGLAHSTTEWTMFFDSDDLMLPDHVERAMKYAQLHPDAEVIGWDRAVNYLNGQRVIRHFCNGSHDFYNVFQSVMSTESYMARTELFKRAGGWAENINMGDDIELGQRILSLKPKIRKASGPITVEVQESAESISSESSAKIRSFIDAYESIRSRLPVRHRHWVDLRYIVLATNEAKGDSYSPEFVAGIIRRTPLRRRWLWQLLYRYSAAGGRGVAFLYNLVRWTGL